MARATFRFYEELNDFLPPERRKTAFDCIFERRGSIKDMIEALGVPHPEVELILVNGESVGFDYLVRDGDRIAVYPVFESFDVSEHLRVRRQPLRSVRFVLDTHLGTLARYLRLCGFDTLYRNDYEDAQLAEVSAKEGRILLTRDRALLKRRIITHGYCVRNDRPPRQLTEVANRFQLQGLVAPFTRCARCNGPLECVDKAEVKHALEPLTQRYYTVFRRCTECGHVYWRGGHVAHIEQLIQASLSVNP
ncbi:Mut7-C RNAse domain-containing protein [Aquisalimonas sp.]|uniref:Mut7-C RNAse domain-containing protein n=1 Tax=Aquisalimonas sp. TaxID=1872621 RepID=UPI0025C1B1BB|nr:Mut7-C RNAse domain-containing protein [Aquisalimonas sp.]